MEARLISWSSWGQILKDSSRELLLPVLLFLLIGLFWFFRPFTPAFVNGLFAIFLFLGCLYWYIKRRGESIEFLIFLCVFLGFAALYNIQFAFSVPLWLSEFVVFTFSFLIFIYLAYEKGYRLNSFLFSFGLSVCLLEVYFILSFWPTNPLSKSFILTALFYSFWFIVTKKEKVLSYLILVAFVLILVMATTRWPLI